MAMEVKITKVYSDFRLQVNVVSETNKIGLLGASGSGKSMTLKCIAGIETPDTGKIVINGKVLFDSEKKINLPPQKRIIGYMFQNYALFPNMTVEENMVCGMSGSKKVKKEELIKLVKAFKLDGLEKRYPKQLSGGQQQRVALARMMAYHPEMILLDEPFSAMDGFLKDILQEELYSMLTEYEGIIMMVSHNRDEIYKFSESISILDHGKSVVYGKTKDIFDRPRKVISAKVTGCKNISKINKISEYELEAIDWGIQLRTKEPIGNTISYVGIRAYKMENATHASKENTMKIQIVKVVEAPFEVQYIFKNAQMEESTQLWWIKGKKKDGIEETDGVPEYIWFPPDKLMLLEQ